MLLPINPYLLRIGKVAMLLLTQIADSYFIVFAPVTQELFYLIRATTISITFVCVGPVMI
jgi:hypothetical protein